MTSSEHVHRLHICSLNECRQGRIMHFEQRPGHNQQSLNWDSNKQSCRCRSDNWYCCSVLYANPVRERLTTKEKEMQPANYGILLLLDILTPISQKTEQENVSQSQSDVVRLTCFILGSSAKPLGLDRAVKCLTMCLKASDFPDPLSPLVSKNNLTKPWWCYYCRRLCQFWHQSSWIKAVCICSCRVSASSTSIIILWTTDNAPFSTFWHMLLPCSHVATYQVLESLICCWP